MSLVVWAGSDKQARQILDNTSKTIANGATKASFTVSGKQTNTSGTIAIKGKKFTATTPQSVIWYDGKTQWTYLKSSEEVNVSTPTTAQQLNPYRFIYLYKSGYKLSSKSVAGGWQVYMKANTQSAAIKEMYITVGRDYKLRQVKLRQSTGWTTITLTNIRKVSLADSQFRFNKKDYPKAEIIDLR